MVRLRRLLAQLAATMPRPSALELLLALLLARLALRYQWMMDDAFIYFRYVDNLLFLDRGLVFNAREYVEAFTSPAWTLLLIGLRAGELDYYSIVQTVTLLCALCMAWALVTINRRLSPQGAVVNFGLAVAAGSYGVATHLSSGLETPLVQLTAVGFGALALWPQSRALQLLLGLAPLVRPELALPLLLYIGWLGVAYRRPPWLLLASTAVCNGSWLLFRIYYYADLLPNTFYLKDGARYTQGLWYLQNVIEAHHLLVVVPLLLALAWYGRRVVPAGSWPTHRPIALMLAAAALHVLYVVRVGGDMLYFRYLAFPFALCLCASGGIVERALRRVQEARALPSGLRRFQAATLSALSFVVVFASYPPQLRSHPITLKAKSRKYHLVAEAQWHRKQPDLRFVRSRPAEDRARLAHYRAMTPAERDHDRVRVTGWCREAYDAPEAYVLHGLALTDLALARVPGTWGRPGHKLVEGQAHDLARLRRRDLAARGRGFIDHVSERKLPRWMRDNRDALRVLEQKAYNRHDLLENLALALQPVRLR